MLCMSVIIQHLLTRILTRLACRANVKIVCYIKQKITALKAQGKCVIADVIVLLENDVIHGVRRCNVVFTIERR